MLWPNPSLLSSQLYSWKGGKYVRCYWYGPYGPKLTMMYSLSFRNGGKLAEFSLVFKSESYWRWGRIELRLVGERTFGSDSNHDWILQCYSGLDCQMSRKMASLGDILLSKVLENGDWWSRNNWNILLL